MIFKSRLPDDPLTQPSEPLCPYYHWVNSSRCFPLLITEICIWIPFMCDLVFYSFFFCDCGGQGRDFCLEQLTPENTEKKEHFEAWMFPVASSQVLQASG